MAITSASNAALSTGSIDNFTLLGSTPLPIKLLSFTASDINHDHVLISWATSMEHLVDHFEIQKALTITDFETIDKVMQSEKVKPRITIPLTIISRPQETIITG